MKCWLPYRAQLQCSCSSKPSLTFQRVRRHSVRALSEPPNKQPAKQEPTDLGDAVIRSLSEVSKNVEGASNKTKMVIGNDQSVEAWRKLDMKVNRYPMPRSFTAIGLPTEEYQEAMKVAVEGVVGPVHVECLSVRKASKGTLMKVTIGPVMVNNADQVIQVYAAMRKDPRTKLCM